MSHFRKLVRELHRRSIWQVLGIYMVGSWAAYQVVVSLMEGLGLPDWVPPMAVILFVVGLPIVLATAFVQEGLPGVEPGGDDPQPAGPAGSGTSDRAGGGALPGASVDGGERAREPKAVPRLFTWKGAITGGVLAFAVLGLGVTGFMAMRNLGIGPVGSLVGKGELEASDHVLVAEFNPLTGDSAIAAVVAEAMRVDLSQSHLLNVVDRSRIRYALERMGRQGDVPLFGAVAREVAVRLGVKAVVEGEVGEVAGSYLLSSKLVTPDSGRVLASFRETASDSSDLLFAVDRLSRKLREKTGESLQAVRETPPLTQVTTTSLPALKKYVRSKELAVAGDRSTAIALLEDALELDPEFASAHRSLAVHMWNQGRRGDSTFRHINEAVRLGDRLTEYERHHARGFQAIATNDLAVATREYEALLAMDSSDHVAIINLGVVHGMLDQQEQALALARRAYDLGDRSINTTYWNIVQGQLNLARYDGAAETVGLAAADHPGSGTVGTMGWLVAMAKGDHAAADSVIDHLEANPDTRGRGVWLDRQKALYEGRPDPIMAWLAGRPDPVAQRFVAVPAGYLELFVLRAPDDAADRVEAALDEPLPEPVPEASYPYASAALLLALAGRTERARAVIEVFRREVRPELLAQHEFKLAAAEGMARVMGGDHAAGLERLERARRLAPCGPCMEAMAGIAFERAGRADSAIVAFERYLSIPWADRYLYNGPGVMPNDLFLGVYVREQLAGLYERLGQPAKARPHLAAIVELWADAAPVLQPRVRAARRGLERLAGEPGP